MKNFVRNPSPSSRHPCFTTPTADLERSGLNKIIIAIEGLDRFNRLYKGGEVKISFSFVPFFCSDVPQFPKTCIYFAGYDFSFRGRWDAGVYSREFFKIFPGREEAPNLRKINCIMFL